MRFNTKPRKAIVAFGLVGSLILAGCSDDDGSTSASDTSAQTTETTAASGDTASADFSQDNFGEGCAAVPADGKGSFEGMSEDPVATAASNNPALSTLVAAVTAANLGDTLNSAEALTVFAPADSAFQKIPKETLDTLLADPTGDLTDILKVHVVEGKMSAQDLIDAGSVKSLQGSELKITADGDTMKVNDSTVVCGNVQTANATVFIIDSVLMPEAADAASGDTASAAFADDNFGEGCAAVPADGKGSFEGMSEDPVATAASNNPALSTLVAAVTAANLGDTLNSAEALTVFAPADSAFQKIPKETLDTLLADPTGDLTDILKVHVVEGKMSAQDLIDAGSVKSLQGSELKITADGDTMKVNDSTVVCGNVQTANATVFIIDSVLMPS
ncbi:MAG: fasciclin domain-containing protein [Candidatus Microthrix sp.]|jgi:transforming growth factor-beta-induced protein|uniref:fasciclin domain-containing protein n=1 Tax=Candidatus Neomicrothrix sp. TaxID=2719034 RepID=UPI001B5335A9|nr:fasciclin domain-containing protein [Candidatus Microthrix sp.]MBP6134570.1 fasciclin domain-containing protein [Candidatus Microthrix sp.]MBP6149229.1 fasciclin domain-containing protein [Candidatus Microthrix sp.]MBP7403386.1 fasciclin domain-containing protein [Candidatus Microthrix sp.]MBP7852076.1 fasciclin domain-containing protein [Candidatus Microthrix sp.]MBP7877399.1 fasciclin domain-containing protein [Candidatus Microthrix sp.]